MNVDYAHGARHQQQWWDEIQHVRKKIFLERCALRKKARREESGDMAAGLRPHNHRDNIPSVRAGALAGTASIQSTTRGPATGLSGGNASYPGAVPGSPGPA